MQFVWLQSEFAFSRNPMMLRQDMPALNGDEVDGSLVLSVGGYKVYEGRVSMPLYMNVAEIVDAYVPFFGEPRSFSAKEDAPCLELIEDWRAIEYRRRVDAVLAYGSGDDYEEYCYALKGGISKQNFRRITSLGDDIFSTRFLNPACNFFMTTRAQSWCIQIPEVELSPLYFILGTNEDIAISSIINDDEYSVSDLIPGIYALSVENLRKWFYDNSGQLVNAFNVYKIIKGKKLFACRIVITEVDATKERNVLKFRNSLGVMERIAVSDSLVNEFSYPQADDTYSSYDGSVDDFKTVRSRMCRTQHMTINTNLSGSERVGYFMDMVSSEEVYLERANGLLIRVIPSVEDLKMAANSDAPIPIELGLDVVETESMIMPEIVTGEEFARGRIHSPQFNNPFN